MKKLSHFTRTEIDNFFKDARAIFKSPALTLLRAPRAQEKSRLLIIVPRKVGSAPQRNKLKRRLRALFYEEKMFLEPHDIGVIARKSATELSFEELKQILLTTYRSANL